MASYEKRGNSYRIKASCGYNAQGKQVFQRMTWTPPEGMTEKQIEKELNRQCVLFDEDCKNGLVVSPIKFEAFAEYQVKACDAVANALKFNSAS